MQEAWKRARDSVKPFYVHRVDGLYFVTTGPSSLTEVNGRACEFWKINPDGTMEEYQPL